MANQISDYECKYLYAIIRKPQEGKTFICLENIKKNINDVHLVITMNTIKSNLQFFSRLKNKFNNDKICIFNSKGKKKENSEDFYHCRSVLDVKKNIIYNNVNIIVLCAHSTRFQTSIIDLLNELEDSKTFNKKIVIHIDEAHSYVPPHRDNIIRMNEFDFVKRINLYSASPFNIWDNSKDIELFKRIFIVDIEKEYDIRKSQHYFGVKDCDFINIGDEFTLINQIIPENILKYSSGQSIWFNDSFPFLIGNEHEFLSFVLGTLKFLKQSNYVNNNNFSYNFIPAYSRKLTHYAIMVYILDIFENGLVVIINGDGTKMYLKDENNTIIESIVEHSNEPSTQIEKLHNKYPNKPIFITGFHCVGMSVTLINENLGNFDNVIFNHTQYKNNPEILYQLCRFLFNYISWKNKEKIKKTKLFNKSQEVLKICLDYEKQIDKIDEEMSDSLREQDEVSGNIKLKTKKIPNEKKFEKLEKFCNISRKKIIVDEDDNEEEKLNELKSEYKKWMNKEISNKVLPKKNNNGFYECSSTGKLKVHYNCTEFCNNIKNWDKTSNFFLEPLKKNKFKFCRIYVVYDDKNDNKNYMWYIRKLEIENNNESLEIIKSIFNK